MKVVKLSLFSLLGAVFFISALHVVNAAVVLNHSPVSRAQSGLVGYWTMDSLDANWNLGLLYDRSGNQKNGTIQTMSTSSTPVYGKIGQGFYFPATGATTTNTVTITPPVTAPPFTMSLWFRLASSTNSTGLVLAWLGLPSDNWNGHYLTINTNNSVGAVSVVNNSFASAASGRTVKIGEWHHLVGVWTSSTDRKVYLDGVLAGSNTTAESPSVTAMFLGQSGVNASDISRFPGTLDDVRVYNRSLSDTEIKELYNAGTVKVNKSATNRKQEGLVGYWPFDSSYIQWSTGLAVDASGNNANGNLINMSTSTSPIVGKISQALLFNGSNQHVTIPTTGLMNNAYTYSAWVKLRKQPNSAQEYGIINISDPVTTADQFMTYNNAYGSPVQSGFVCGSYYNSTSVNRANGDVLRSLNTWYYVTCVRDTTTSKIYLYVNGNLVSSSALTSNTAFYASDNGAIGSRVPGGDNSSYFNGIIDEPRIYNRALSAAEIGQLYNIGKVTFAASPINRLTSGLLAYWTFDGSATNWRLGSTSDMSGNGNGGSMIFMSTTTDPSIGKFGQALRFATSSGNNSHVLIPYKSTLNITGTNPITISAWIKTSTTTFQVNQTIYNYGRGGVGGVRTGITTTRALRFSKSGVANIDSVASIYPNDRLFHFITFVDTGSQVQYYVDGALADTVNNSQSKLTAAGDNEQIGLGVSSGGIRQEGFQGVIDDVRVYNRALSTAEVFELYNMGR